MFSSAFDYAAKINAIRQGSRHPILGVKNLWETLLAWSKKGGYMIGHQKLTVG
jgi:hypothetical protein